MIFLKTAQMKLYIVLFDFMLNTVFYCIIVLFYHYFTMSNYLYL